MNKIKLLLSLIFASLFFTACQNLTESIDQSSEPADEPVRLQTGRVSGSLYFYGDVFPEDLIQLSDDSENQNNSRSLFPLKPDLTDSSYEIIISAVKQSDNSKDSAVITDLNNSSTPCIFSVTNLTLDIWYKIKIEVKSGDTFILEGLSERFQLTSGSPVNPNMHITLAPVQSQNGTGTVILNTTVYSDIKSVYYSVVSNAEKWTNNGVRTASLSVENFSASNPLINETNVPSGSYDFLIKFYSSTDCSGSPLYVTRQSVNVFDGLTTSRWAGNDECISDGGSGVTLNITEELCNNFNIITDFYIDSNLGRADNSGTWVYPLQTIEQAFAKMNDSSKDYTINISTDLGPQEINISSITANSVTIRGDGENIKIQGDSTHRALYLNTPSGKDIIIENIKITGGTSEYGGGIYIGGQSKISLGNEVLVTNNTATQSGGGIYITGASNANYPTLSILPGAKITGNINTATGKGISADKYAKVTMTGGEIYDNTGSGTNGGGIYLNDHAEYTITGGKISGNESSSGGAVYITEGCKFIMSGSAYLPYGANGATGAGKNDIYLPSSNTCVYIGGHLIPPSAATVNGTTIVATITSYEWNYGIKVLEGLADTYENIQSDIDYFNVSDTNGWTVMLSGDNKTAVLAKPIYVAASDSTRKVCSAPPSTGANGSKAKPYSKLEDALSDLNNKDADFYIYIDGIIEGEQKIEELGKTSTASHKAKSLTVTGINDLDSQGKPQDGFNGAFTAIQDNKSVLSISSGSLTLNNATPVTLTNLLIKGGWSKANGSGLKLSNNANVIISDGVLIKENITTANGGGISCTNSLLTINGGEISGNTAVKGDAVYLSGAANTYPLSLSGNVYIPAGANGANHICVENGIVKLEGTLANHNSSSKIQIMHGKPNRGFALLGGTKLSDEIGKVSLVLNSGFILESSGTNIGKLKLKNTPSTLYVNYSSTDAFDATSSDYAGTKAGEYDYIWNPAGSGTTCYNENSTMPSDKPFKNLKTALLFITNQNVKQNYTIKIIGGLSGSQSIENDTSTTKPVTLDTSATVSAITLEGNTGSSTDSINGGYSSTSQQNGRALKINTSVPVTITKLKITGGWTNNSNNEEGYGGGIYITGNGTVKLSDDSIIIGNHANFGGGIYVSSGSTLFMYGTALIGQSGYTGTSDLGFNNANINAARKSGGGIYSVGSVYIGYSGFDENSKPAGTAMSNSSSYGILRNYALEVGGGICSSNGTLVINNGYIRDNKTAGTGGGIYCTGNNNSIKTAYINSNDAASGGGIAVSSGLLTIDDDVTMESNHASNNGGAIFLGVGNLVMSKGHIGGATNTKKNRADGNGGAIFVNGTVKLSGDLVFSSGGAGVDDIYLPQNKIISTGGITRNTHIAVTMASYSAGATVLSKADGCSDEDFQSDISKYTISNRSWGISNEGLLQAVVSVTADEAVDALDNIQNGQILKITGSITPNQLTQIKTKLNSIANAIWSGTMDAKLFSLDLSGVTGLTAIPNELFYAGIDYKNIYPLETIKLPSSVTQIGNKAFGLNHNLKSVNIPDGVTSIGYEAFKYTVIENITIPATVTAIGAGAFTESSIKKLIIPDSVTSLGVEVAYRCHNLEEIRFPDNSSITEIPESSCSSCENLTTVTYGSYITKIGESAFSACQSLESFEIQPQITELGRCSFSSTNTLSSITIPASCRKIGEYAFSGSGLSSISFEVTSGWKKSEDNTPVNVTSPDFLNDLTYSAMYGVTGQMPELVR